MALSKPAPSSSSVITPLTVGAVALKGWHDTLRKVSAMLVPAALTSTWMGLLLVTWKAWAS